MCFDAWKGGWFTKGRRGNCTLVKPRYPPSGIIEMINRRRAIERCPLALVDGRQSSYTRTSSRWNPAIPMDVCKRKGGEGRRTSTWNSRRGWNRWIVLKTACPLLYLAARCGDRVALEGVRAKRGGSVGCVQPWSGGRGVAFKRR